MQPLFIPLKTEYFEAFDNGSKDTELWAVWNASEGKTLVCDGVLYTSATGMVQKIVMKAGLEVYSKPLHTLRKNCETDWIDRLPITAVADLLGNSPAVAMKHYAKAEQHHLDQVTENRHNEAHNEEIPEAETSISIGEGGI